MSNITDVIVDVRRGSGSSLEILYGSVTVKPTLAHSRATSIVLPAPSTFDIVDGTVTIPNMQPTPAPDADQMIAWGYTFVFKDRHSKTYEFLVGVPDSVTPVNFASLPRYAETKSPIWGEGPKGDPGEGATVAVGTVSEGTEASVTNSGTNADAVLDFVLPEGPQGIPGEGVPTGGSALQVIRKDPTGATTEWADLTKALVGLSNVDNTSDASKPVSTPQKTYIDQSNTLGYSSKLASDLPNTYPEGVTVALFRIQDGWPATVSSATFTVIKTDVPRQFAMATQWAYAYKPTEALVATNTPIMYRQGYGALAWGEWQTLATTDAVVGLIAESRSNAFYVDIADFGAERDGPDASAAIMAANAVAVAQKKTLVGSGTYYIQNKVNITANCDFSSVRFLCDLEGVAIEVTSVRKKHLFGDIENTRKTAGGWSSVVGSKGLVIRNCNTSTFGYAFIRNFEHGLTVYGDNGGSAYNTFHCGALWHNKVNLVLETTTNTNTGYSNQNTFIGGRWQHESGDSGINAPGVKQVWFRGGISPDDGGRSNNNTFVGSSFEGAAPEYTVDFERASQNILLNCRYEFGNKIRFGSVSRDNNMIGGFGLAEIVKVIEDGATRNRWEAGNERTTYQVVDSLYSSAGATHPWYRSNWADRSIAIGVGSAEPRKIRAIASSALAVDASWHPAEPNTYDLGTVSRPWRNQFISTVRAIDNFVIPIRTNHPPTPQPDGVSLYAILGSPNRVVAQFPDGTVNEL